VFRGFDKWSKVRVGDREECLSAVYYLAPPSREAHIQRNSS